MGIKIVQMYRGQRYLAYAEWTPFRRFSSGNMESAELLGGAGVAVLVDPEMTTWDAF
jgi:hypothetical protein